MFTRTSSCGSLSNASDSAPSEPWTSAFTIRFISGTSARSACRIRSDSVGGREITSSAERIFASRSEAMWRASRSSSTSRKSSPALGTWLHPRICTGFDRPAWIRDRPFSSCMARIFANAVPQISASPADSVPFCTSTVAIGPRPLSRCASITVPRAYPVGSPFSSSRSATSRIVSSNVSSPALVFAETSTNSNVPPYSDGTMPSSTIWVRTRTGSASSLSTLFTATMIGTPAAFA